MLIIDGDYPMAVGAMDLNRNLTLPIEEVRRTKPDHFTEINKMAALRPKRRRLAVG